MKREYHQAMSKPQPKANEAGSSERDDSSRFEDLTRALFRVDKRDVEKHEPTKRGARPSAATPRD